MSDARVEAVRSLVSTYRRTRRTRSEAFPTAIKSAVLGLIGSGRSIPELSRQVGIASVLMYQWRKDAHRDKENSGHDLFIELPVAPLIASSGDLPRQRHAGVVEIRRADISTVLRIECSGETIGLVVKEFLGGISAC